MFKKILSCFVVFLLIFNIKVLAIDVNESSLKIAEKTKKKVIYIEPAYNIPWYDKTDIFEEKPDNGLHWYDKYAIFDDKKSVSLLDEVKNTFKEGYDIDYALDKGVDGFKNLDSYDIIIIATHGGADEEHGYLATGEAYSKENQKKYEEYLNEGSLYLSKKGKYAINEKFIKKYSGKLNNSIVFIGACSVMKNAIVCDTFINNGAKVCYGFNEDEKDWNIRKAFNNVFGEYLKGSDLKTMFESGKKVNEDLVYRYRSDNPSTDKQNEKNKEDKSILVDTSLENKDYNKVENPIKKSSVVLLPGETIEFTNPNKDYMEIKGIKETPTVNFAEYDENGKLLSGRIGAGQWTWLGVGAKNKCILTNISKRTIEIYGETVGFSDKGIYRTLEGFNPIKINKPALYVKTLKAGESIVYKNNTKEKATIISDNGGYKEIYDGLDKLIVGYDTAWNYTYLEPKEKIIIKNLKEKEINIASNTEDFNHQVILKDFKEIENKINSNTKIKNKADEKDKIEEKNKCKIDSKAKNSTNKSTKVMKKTVIKQVQNKKDVKNKLQKKRK